MCGTRFASRSRRVIGFMKTSADLKWEAKEQTKGRSKARRSQRLALQVPVLVYEVGRDQRFILDDSYAVIVSKHGAMLVLSQNVNSSQRLLVTNKRTKESKECRVVFVGPNHANKRRVGVEFLEPAPHFWGIFFPPVRNTQALDGTP